MKSQLQKIASENRYLLCASALTLVPLCWQPLRLAAQDLFTEGTSDTRARGGNRLTFSRPREVPETHTIRQGDTLWDITQRYYGDPYEWPRIWSYNPEITNPHWVYPDGVVRLRLPGSQPGIASGQAHLRTTSRSGRVVSGTIFVSDDGYLDREALRRAGRVMNSPEDHLMLAPSDVAYVTFADAPDGFVPTGDLAVFRFLNVEDNEPRANGEMVRVLGTVHIESYDRERRVATVRVVDALDPIERGFWVADVPRQFRMVEPSAADVDLNTTIVATLNPSILIGQSVMVYIPKGSEDGVQVGNQFVVPRNVDRWVESLYTNPTNIGATENPGNLDELPDEVVAQGRVVFVQPHSSAIWITQASEELGVGDPVVMRRGH